MYKRQPLGHGEKSVIILQQYITLTSDEIYAIRWHMGGFDDTAKSWAGGLALSSAMGKCPLLALLHMADLATNYISTVSYTHLDVYKRQDIKLMRMALRVGCVLLINVVRLTNLLR